MNLSRRTLLLGASGLLLAGCTPAPAAVITPTAVPTTGGVREALEAAMVVFDQNTDLFGVAITDLRTGATFDHRADFAAQSASIAKVMIVAMSLRAARAGGREFTFEEYGYASRAIIDSDNDSADALWASYGGSATYRAFAEALGLAQTHPDERRDFWSWTWTTPADQRRLLDALVHGSPELHTEDRLYLLDLMSKTNEAQTWGVGEPRSDKVWVEMKNGWVVFESTDGLWAVNSIGRVTGDGRDYLATVMCRVPTFEDGRALTSAIGASIFEILGTGELS